MFGHFDEYCEDGAERRARIDRINELERWLNLEIQKVCREPHAAKIVNAYRNRARITDEERKKRAAFHTDEAEKKIKDIVEQVKRVLGTPSGVR